MKVVCDALNGCAYDDDKQIVSAVVLKKYAEIPMVEIMLYDGEEVSHA